MHRILLLVLFFLGVFEAVNSVPHVVDGHTNDLLASIYEFEHIALGLRVLAAHARDISSVGKSEQHLLEPESLAVSFLETGLSLEAAITSSTSSSSRARVETSSTATSRTSDPKQNREFWSQFWPDFCENYCKSPPTNGESGVSSFLATRVSVKSAGESAAATDTHTTTVSGTVVVSGARTFSRSASTESAISAAHTQTHSRSTAELIALLRGGSSETVEASSNTAATATATSSSAETGAVATQGTAQAGTRTASSSVARSRAQSRVNTEAQHFDGGDYPCTGNNCFDELLIDTDNVEPGQEFWQTFWGGWCKEYCGPLAE